jgi:mRNA m6A methyltransferase catalytic subunit
MLAQTNEEKYDVLVVDPPWKIHMESLPYEVLQEDDQVIDGLGDIVHLQAPGGLIFLWTTTRAVEMGILCLEKWGYTLVEEMVWVKINQLGRIIRTGMTGHWLNHTKEHCLVGMKGDGNC